MISKKNASESERAGFHIQHLPIKKGVRIGIVRCLFRSAFTEPMQTVAESRAKTLGASVQSVCLARGVLDTPLVVAALLVQKKIDAAVVLGAVIKGQTAHDDVVVRETTAALVQLSLQYHKPVGIGIIGPGVNLEQAHERVAEYAQGAVDAVVLSASKMDLKNVEILNRNCYG